MCESTVLLKDDIGLRSIMAPSSLGEVLKRAERAVIEKHLRSD